VKQKLWPIIVTLCLTAIPALSFADASSFGVIDVEDDDLRHGNDIFSDFSEDIESAQVTEDERYYRYGRFYTMSIGFGTTGFTGNRGAAYEDENPSYYFALHPFLDFNFSFGLGLEFSKHHFYIDQATNHYQNPPGLIEVSMTRFFLDFRHYVDTIDLGTAITFANPYLAARLEYWYQTNKFIDQSSLDNESGGGFGMGAGFGLEFPIKLSESFVGVEFLMHQVNFFDKYTQKYAPQEGNENGFGYDDLTGYAYSIMVTYVFNWQ